MKSVLDDRSNGIRYPFRVSMHDAFRVAASVLQSMGNLAIEAHPREHYLLAAGPLEIRGDATDLSQWIPQNSSQDRFLWGVWLSPAGTDETEVTLVVQQDTFIVGSGAEAAEEKFFSGFRNAISLLKAGKALPGIRQQGGRFYAVSKPQKWPNEPDRYVLVNGLDQAESYILRVNSEGKDLSKVPLRISKAGYTLASIITGRKLIEPGAPQSPVPQAQEEPSQTIYPMERSRWGGSFGAFSSVPFPSLSFAALGLNYRISDWLMVDWMVGFATPPLQNNSSGSFDVTTGPGFELMPYRVSIGLGRVLGPTVGIGYYHYFKSTDLSAFGVSGADFVAPDLGLLCILTTEGNHLVGVQVGVTGSVVPVSPFEPYIRIMVNPF